MDINYKTGHVGALDGIRGCAILLVLIYHCVNISIFPFNHITEIGWTGVDLFFVLSGFLITGILIDTKRNNNFLITFFFKRALRIFPLYYLSLLIFFVVLSLPEINEANKYLDKRHFEDIFYYLTYTQNINFSFNGWGITDILNPFWSLAIEEQFYLVWPLVILLTKNNKLLFISIPIIAISLITRNLSPDNPFSYVFTLARFDSLAIGSIAAFLIRRDVKFLNKYVLPIFIISICVLAVVVFITKSVSIMNPHFIRYGYTLFDILFACIIIFIFDKAHIGKLSKMCFDTSFLRFFGRYSYGIYVYHWLLYRGVYNYLELKYSLNKIYIIPFLIFVILVSMLSYHLYEKRFLKYKSKIDENTNWKETLLLIKKKLYWN